jgi:hypothetical protein
MGENGCDRAFFGMACPFVHFYAFSQLGELIEFFRTIL